MRATVGQEASSMDFTNPVLNADWPDPARPGLPDGEDHVAFGGMSVDLAGGEEVAA